MKIHNIYMNLQHTYKIHNIYIYEIYNIYMKIYNIYSKIYKIYIIIDFSPLWRPILNRIRRYLDKAVFLSSIVSRNAFCS